MNSMILYDLFLVIMGIFIGVIARDPIKKLFTGGYKEDMRQKKRVKLFLFLREEAVNKKLTTSELADKVFAGKEKEQDVQSLLEEIEKFGLIKSISKSSGDTKMWFYKKSGNKNND